MQNTPPMLRRLLSVLMAAGTFVAVSVQAGTNYFGFNSDPAGILDVFGIGGGGGGTWYSTNGSTLEVGINPSTNGYFSVTDAVDSQRAVILFDDFDAGLVVAAFKFSMDVRTGGGDDQPADGFSINYCSADDPVVVQRDGNGFASSPTGEANLPEEGTQTGLAICFDEWFSGGADVIGLTIRVDNTIVTNVPLPTLNGACADTTSMQTGPNAGGVAALCWQPLTAELTLDGKLNVSYKGVFYLTNFAVNFAPRPGRLVFTGRTGGNNANNHVDNIRIMTVPSAKPVVGPTTANANGFKFSISDSGPSTPDTNTITVTLDGAPVALTSISQSGNVGGGNGLTFVAYQNTSLLLASSSTHTSIVHFTGSTFPGAVDVTNIFTIPPYTLLASADKAPGAVNTGLSGFAGRVHQLPIARFPDAISLIGVERQLADGFIDPATSQPYASIALASTFTDDDGINWSQDFPFGAQVGHIRSDAVAPADWADEGIPGVDAVSGPGTDNIAAELLTILNLPVGAYQLGLNHDDGIKLTAGAEPRDALRSRLLASDQGAVDSPSINIVVTNAGNYPVRIAWGEGGGGAHLEFYLTDFSTGQRILVNNRTNPVQITAYRDTAALTQPYVRWVFPAPGETGVNPDAQIIVKLEDNTAGTITDASIQIQLNGTPLTVATANAGATTTATANHATVPSGSTNTVTLVYSTSSGGPFTNSWSFTSVTYAPLPTGLRTAVGSGDAAKPGFVGKVWQVGINQYQNFQNDNDNTDVALLGLWGTNQATLGSFTETTVINYGVASEGTFANPAGNMPGLPGTEFSTDNVAYEFLTYVEFPTVGFYSMGVQSDDGFRLTLGDSAGPSVPTVQVVAPSDPSITRRFGALQTFQPRNGFGGPIPAAGISARLVAADPILAGGPLANASAIAGNIALVARGTFGFAVKAKNAQDAGAVAIIIYNATQANPPGLPQIMGGADATVTIPCFMISQDDGTNLLAYATTASTSPVFMNIHDGDKPMVINQFNGGRGAGTPTTFGIYVTQAGVYPMRLCFENAGGGNSVEWWSETATGARVLLNDTASASALKTYQARTVAGGAPQFNAVALSGGNVVFSWTGVGEVEQSPTVNGPWTTSANQGNPQTNSPSATPQLLYRVRQY